MDLAYDPFLYADDIGRGGDFRWAPVLEPCVGEAAGGHSWAGVLVADRVAGVSVGFLDYLDHAGEEAVHFDDCVVLVLAAEGHLKCRWWLTLVG